LSTQDNRMVFPQCEVLHVHGGFLILKKTFHTEYKERVLSGSHQCELSCGVSRHLEEQRICYTENIGMVSHQCELLNVSSNDLLQQRVCYNEGK